MSNIDLELFNAHQEDVRKRTDSLAKSIFVLSGGALTISIGIFTNPAAPKLTSATACALRASWISLVTSIILVMLMLAGMILRDYHFGEQWRRSLIDPTIDVSGTPSWPDTLLKLLGISGLVTLVIGLALQCYVACKLL